MAIYSCSVKTMSRSSGRSATAAAAYRSGTAITDRRTGEIHDYQNKGRNGVESSGVILPKNAPSELNDRENLWNAAEDSENRKNSVVAREVMVAIPHELNKEQREELVKGYSQSLSDRYQVGVDYSIHKPDNGGDERNNHAHIMMTTRRINENGFGEKTRELDAYKSTGKLEINNIRQSWEEHANRSLEKAGKSERIDSRTLKDQGIDREPTKHVGVSGTAIDRKGLFSERAEINREIRELNQERIGALKELKQLHAQRRELQGEINKLKDVSKNTYRDLKKNERVEKAVETAKSKAPQIHAERQQKSDNYHFKQIDKSQARLDKAQLRVDSLKAKANRAWTQKSFNKTQAQIKGAEKMLGNAKRWHEEARHKHSTPENRRQAAIDKGQQDLAKVDRAEPKKRFWQSQEKHDSRYSDWRKDRDQQLEKARANVERADPTAEKSIDIASGKAAYEHKVSKDTIRERYHVDNKAITEQSKGRHEDIRDKLKSQIEQQKSVRSDVSTQQTRLEKIQAKLKEAESKRDQNAEKIKDSQVSKDRGESMKESNKVEREEPDKQVERTQQLEQGKKASREERPEPVKQADGVERSESAKPVDKPERVEADKQADKAERPEPVKQADGVERSETAKPVDKPERVEADKQADKAERPEPVKQADGVERSETAKPVDKPERVETDKQADKAERPEPVKQADSTEKVETARPLEKSERVESGKPESKVERSEPEKQSNDASVDSKREALKQKAEGKNADKSEQIEKGEADKGQQSSSADRLEQQREALKEKLNEKETSKTTSQEKDDGLGY